MIPCAYLILLSAHHTTSEKSCTVPGLSRALHFTEDEFNEMLYARDKAEQKRRALASGEPEEEEEWGVGWKKNKSDKPPVNSELPWPLNLFIRWIRRLLGKDVGQSAPITATAPAVRNTL